MANTQIQASPDAFRATRCAGVRTHVKSADWADVTEIHASFDRGTSDRAVAGWGPALMGHHGALLRPWHRLFGSLFPQGANLDPTRGIAYKAAAQIVAGLEPIVAAGAIALVRGGDDPIVLGDLCANVTVDGVDEEGAGTPADPTQR